MFKNLFVVMYVNGEKTSTIGKVNADNDKVYCDLFDAIEGIQFNDWIELVDQAKALQSWLEDHPEEEWTGDTFYYTYTDENGVECEDSVLVEIELA